MVNAAPAARGRESGPQPLRAGIVGLDPSTGLLIPLLLNFVVPFLVAGYSRQRLLKRLSDHAHPGYP
jgi:hypothetical protein